MNFTEFFKWSLNFILKFSTLILTKKLQSHFFMDTETLNSDKSSSNQCYLESEAVASLGLMSPGGVTNGVTLFFPKKLTTFLVIVLKTLKTL